MFRWLFRAWFVVSILPLLLVAAVVATFLVVRPPLSDGRDQVDRRWAELRSPLVARYDQLEAARAAFAAAGGADRDVTAALEAPLRRWAKLRDAQPGDVDAGAEARLANQLEAGAARLAANVSANPRFSQIQAVTTPLISFQGTASGLLPMRDAYNRAVRRYEDDRTSMVRKPMAELLGFDQRAVLVLPG